VLGEAEEGADASVGAGVSVETAAVLSSERILHTCTCSIRRTAKGRPAT
jgi:hypothetical protein